MSGMEYKGYTASIEYSSEDESLIGKVLGIDDTIIFDGLSVEEITNSFHSAVDEYLDYCASIGKNPDKEYKGSFNVRISPELHKSISIAAQQQGISLNQFVGNALAKAI